MKTFVIHSLKYILIAIIVVPLSIVTHELGHFVMYQWFGASNVQLHSVSVSAEKETLSNVQLAVASIIGPIITYLTIGLVVFFTRKQYTPFWLILALAAPLGRIVNAVYIYFRILGYHPNPNFDEFNFSRSLNIEPLLIAIPTTILVGATLIYFCRTVWGKDGLRELFAVSLSLVCGLSVWMVIGPLVLP